MLYPCLPFVFSKKGVKLVEIYPGSFLFQIAAFALLYFLLKKYAFGPILQVMQKRQQLIEDQMNNAEKNRTEAEKLLQEQNEALQKTRLESYEIIENAKLSSTKQANEILEKAKSEAERIKDQALQEIQLEKQQAVAELRDQVGALSVMIASKMIEKELDVKSQSKFIDDIMKKVGESL